MIRAFGLAMHLPSVALSAAPVAREMQEFLLRHADTTGTAVRVLFFEAKRGRDLKIGERFMLGKTEGLRNGYKFQ